MSKKTQALDAIIAPVVTGLGYEFLGCLHIAQGHHSLLRVYIDNHAGITLGDCEKVSRQVSSVLDVEDPMATHYTLEVSSPGFERPLFTLAHYQRFIGQTIKLRLHAPQNGRRNFSGILTDVIDEQIVVKTESAVFTLPFAAIDRANLIPEFPRE